MPSLGQATLGTPSLEPASVQPRRSETLTRLFAHEVVRPSSPVSGFLCVRSDYTHPVYPGLRWLPGSEHLGHFIISTQPLGSLSWLPPEDRLFMRVVECALTPGAIIGGGQETVEADRVLVSAERSKPMGPYTEALQGFWASLQPDRRGPDLQLAIELASEALLRFRLYGRFACRGVSIVKMTVNRTGWVRPGHETGQEGWQTAWSTAMDEMTELRLKSLSESEWLLVSNGVGDLIDQRLSAVPRPALLRDHILATSYALAAGPAASRLNPFAPLVTLGLMGQPALGMVGDWFWIGGSDELVGHRHAFRAGMFDV